MDVTGDNGDNTLTGTPDRDVLVGLGGNDTLSGGAEGDILYGDDTAGLENAASGNDTLYGEAGADLLIGGNGADRLFGGGGEDVIVAGRASFVTRTASSYAFRYGDGSAIGNGGNLGDSSGDEIDGGAGNDIAIISYLGRTAGGVVLDASDPAITRDITSGGVRIGSIAGIERVVVFGSNNADEFRGGAGNDLLQGERGSDILYGGDGNDTLIGDNPARAMSTLSNNFLYGGDGNDTLVSGLGNDLLDGGAGIDTVAYETAATVDLAVQGAQQTASSEMDTLVSIENLIGSVFSDLFSGDANANVLTDTRGGNDQFYGLGGNDTLRISRNASSDQVRLDGGIGDDTISVSGVQAAVIDGGADNDTISASQITSLQLFGGVGNDTIALSAIQSGSVGGGAGDDTFTVSGLRSLSIDGGTGRDSVALDSVFRTVTFTATSGGTQQHQGAATTLFATGVESFTFADGRYIVDADSTGAQVQRMYDTVLGRAPDAGGLDYWVDRIEDDGQTLAAVAQALASGPEFQGATGGLGNAAFVDYVYGRALGRAADQGGRDYWTGRLDAGLSRGDMLVLFSEGEEHRGRTAALTGQGYFQTDDQAQAVALLYDSAVGRLPDAPGLFYWTNQLKTGASLAQIADAFAASPEFTAATQGKTNAQVVDFLYGNTLDRAGDDAGRAYWTGQLDGGLSRAQLLLAFSQGEEHQQLYANHIIGGIDVLM